MKLLAAAAALLVASPAVAAGQDYVMTVDGFAQAADDEMGRIKVKFPASADPDRPIIVGAVPNRAGQQNRTDLEFVVSRASRATPKLMEYCANGKVLPTIEIGALKAGSTETVYTLYDARFLELRSGRTRIAQGARNSRDIRAAARDLREDPVIRISYACAEFENFSTGEKSAPCPQAGKASGEVTMKGAKIKEN